MKKFNVFSTVMITVMILVIVTLAMAKGPVGEIITIYWCEDGTRYYANGELDQAWLNTSIGPVHLIQTGKAYHFADMIEFYWPGADADGSLVISEAGQLSGHTTYTSTKSGLPIRDRFKGEVTINAEEGTMVGSYAQWGYAFGTEGEVSYYYDHAIKDEIGEEEPCWWLVGYTEYVVHVCE